MANNITKTQKENLLNLYQEDFANYFNISFIDGKYRFNINKNVYFTNFDTFAPRYFYRYEVKEKDTWPLIAYKQHGTIELWWLVCRVNQIWNPLEDPKPGDILKILNDDIVDQILKTINTQ